MSVGAIKPQFWPFPWSWRRTHSRVARPAAELNNEGMHQEMASPYAGLIGRAKLLMMSQNKLRDEIGRCAVKLAGREGCLPRESWKDPSGDPWAFGFAKEVKLPNGNTILLAKIADPLHADRLFLNVGLLPRRTWINATTQEGILNAFRALKGTDWDLPQHQSPLHHCIQYPTDTNSNRISLGQVRLAGNEYDSNRNLTNNLSPSLIFTGGRNSKSDLRTVLSTLSAMVASPINRQWVG